MMSRRGNISAEQLEEEEFSRAVSSAETVPPPQNQNKSSRATRNSSRTRSTAAASSSSNKSSSRKRSSKGNSSNRSKHPSGNDKLYSNYPSRDTYDELTHEGKPPLPSANTKLPPRSNMQKIKALNGSNQPDPNVDLTELFNKALSCTEEDKEEFSEGIGDKSGNLPEETWDLSNDNVILCEECDKAPASTRPVVPATHSKKGTPGAFPNNTCATCANKSPVQFMTKPCCMADGNEVKEGRGKTCENCRENRVCVNFETCNGKKRYRIRNSTIFEKCETCYKESIATRKCKNCPKIGLVEGTALCDDCAKLSSNNYQDKHKGRDKDARCERCHHLYVEGSGRYYVRGGSGGVGLKVCTRNDCNKKCRVVLRVGTDGKNIYCDDPIMPGDKNKSCGGFYRANDSKRTRVHQCRNTTNTATF